MLKDKSNDHLNRCTKDLWQSATCIHDKNHRESRNGRSILQHNKNNVYVCVFIYVYIYTYMNIHEYMCMYINIFTCMYVCIYQPTISIYPEYRKSQGYPTNIRNKTGLLTIPTPSNTVLKALSPWAIKEKNEIKGVQTGWVKKVKLFPFT